MKAREASESKLSFEERETLERYVRRRKSGRSIAQGAEIILRAAAGENNCEIARAVQATRQTVRVWRERFAKRRLQGLDEEPRCGAPCKIGDERIEAVVTKNREEKPAKFIAIDHHRFGERAVNIHPYHSHLQALGRRSLSDSYSTRSAICGD